MPRTIRVQYPGAIDHLMSRGDRREDIFLDDVDRQDCVKTLAEACQKTGFEVHADCLMRNHFHLVVETPDANLVAGMAWLLSAYTIGLNHRHKLFGHVQERQQRTSPLGEGEARCRRGHAVRCEHRAPSLKNEPNYGLTPILYSADKEIPEQDVGGGVVERY